MFAQISHRCLKRHLSADPGCCHCRSRLLALVGLLIVAMLISACGTGAFRRPSPSPRASATGSASSLSPSDLGASAAGGAAIRSSANPTVSLAPRASTGRHTYTYSLPYGDTSYAQDDEVVYSHLLGGDCAAAQNVLDQRWWELGIGGPREVVMMQVAIDLCRKNDSAARRLFDVAAKRYGRVGLSQDVWSCNIYRAAGSYLWQIPPNSRELACLKGDVPLWPGNSYFPSQPVRACEDPRFGTGKCAGPAPSVMPSTPIPSSPSAPAGSGSPTPATETPISSSSASTTS